MSFNSTSSLCEPDPGLEFNTSTSSSNKLWKVLARVFVGLSLATGLIFNSLAVSRVVKLFSDLVPVSLLNFRYLQKTNELIYVILNTNLLPFDGLNISDRWFGGSGCSSMESFAKKDVKCNIMDNYSQDLMTIYGLIFMTATFGFVGYITQKWGKKKTDKRPPGEEAEEPTNNWVKVAVYLRNVCINLLSYTQAESVCYGSVHLMYSTVGSLSMIIGTVLSLKLLLCFIVMEAMRINVIIKIWFYLKDNRRSMIGTEKDSSLEKALTISGIKNRALVIGLEDDRIPKYRISLLIPILGSAKNFILALFVVTLYPYPAVQIALSIILELVYLFILFPTKTKMDRLENYLEIFISCFTSVFLILMLYAQLSTGNVDSIDLAASWVLILIVFVTSLFGIYFLLAKLCDYVKSKKNIRKIENSKTKNVENNQRFELGKVNRISEGPSSVKDSNIMSTRRVDSPEQDIHPMPSLKSPVKEGLFSMNKRIRSKKEHQKPRKNNLNSLIYSPSNRLKLRPKKNLEPGSFVKELQRNGDYEQQK